MLIQEVRNSCGVQEGESSSVERVLRNWNKDAGLRGGADDVEEGVDTGGGTGGQVDVIGICREAIAT
jgi:hypothetical protein